MLILSILVGLLVGLGGTGGTFALMRIVRGYPARLDNQLGFHAPDKLTAGSDNTPEKLGLMQNPLDWVQIGEWRGQLEWKRDRLGGIDGNESAWLSDLENFEAPVKKLSPKYAKPVSTQTHFVPDARAPHAEDFFKIEGPRGSCVVQGYRVRSDGGVVLTGIELVHTGCHAAVWYPERGKEPLGYSKQQATLDFSALVATGQLTMDEARKFEAQFLEAQRKITHNEPGTIL